MSHSVDSCPLTKLNGSLSQLHFAAAAADDDDMIIIIIIMINTDNK